MVKSMNSETRLPDNLTTYQLSDLGQLLNLSVPQFSKLYNGCHNNTHFTGYKDPWEEERLMLVKYFGNRACLEHVY